MPDFPENIRLILAHKQSTSARVRFFSFAHGITAFEPLSSFASFDAENRKHETHFLTVPRLYRVLPQLIVQNKLDCLCFTL